MDTRQKISELGLANSAAVVHPANTVMLSRTASVGHAVRIGRAMATTQAFVTWTCGPRLDPRYLLLVLNAMRPEFDRIAYGSTHPTIYFPDIEQLRVPVPPTGTQRAIADYLDAKTGRVDSLIAKKRRMIRLNDEQQTQLLPAAMAKRGFQFPDSLLPDWHQWELPAGWVVLRLSQALDGLTNGYVGPTRDILVEEGIRYIQSLHIKGGKIDFERRPFYVSEEWHRKRPRIHLGVGDVLIVQTGDIGQVAVVPDDFGEASCHALQIARVRKSLLSGEYLGEYLRTSFGYQSLLCRATGALHPHLEGGIRDIPVVLPPKEIQGCLLEEVTQHRLHLDNLQGHLTRQIALLVEHRQALITAAVTGELEVAGAAM